MPDPRAPHRTYPVRYPHMLEKAARGSLPALQDTQRGVSCGR